LYQWSTGSTSPVITLKESAQVWAEVNYYGCTARDTLTIALNPLRTQPLQIYQWCSTKSIPLKADQNNAESYLWNNGSTQPTITASTPGLYWCTVNWKNCSIRDSFLLNTFTLHPLGLDTLVCANRMPYTMKASTPGAYAYVWNDQSRDSIKTVTTPGIYWVDIYIDSCIIRDTLTIETIEPIELTSSPDTFVCAGQSITLKASGAESYRWSGPNLNTTDPSVVVRPSANAVYRVTGYSKNQCYSISKDIRVDYYATPVVDAGPDTTMLAGSSITLSPTFSADVQSFLWTPAQFLSCTTCSNPVATPFAPITYTLQVTNKYNCQSADFRVIKLFCNNSTLFVPNTFTPNGDGMNDIFYPRGRGIKSITYFRVYNRWGQLLFERLNTQTENKSQGWDGTFNGKKLPPDIFVYTLGVICADDKFYEAKGNVMILK
ncbi:MAG: gliding motility-associated C-terminal domain-containing protein, partial [Chitinophagaceae bacterium]